MTMKNLSVALGVVFLVWESQPLFCQAGSSIMGSAVPLENWNIAGRRMGGISVGLADDVPNILANPANLASLDRPQIFLSLNNARKDFTIQTNMSTASTDVSWTQGFNLGYSAASIPFHIFKRRLVLAVSYNGRKWGEFDERYFSETNELLGFGRRSGHVQSLSTGLGIQVLSKIRAGVSWTTWFGESEWEYSAGLATGIDDNAAQGWYGGVAAELGRFSLGSIIALPHRIMKSKNTFLLQLPEVTKQFNGALEIGLGYHPSSRWTFGLGYGYQRGFDFESRYGSVHVDEKSPAFSKVSGGIEYKLSLGKVRLPVYAGYQAFGLHEPMGFLPFYVQIPISDGKRFGDHLLLGATAQIGSLAFYFDSKLTWYDYQMIGILPPWS
jgi:hypothetical protein